VDDNEAILQSLERGLLNEPYNKLFVKSCKEALEIIRREEVHVIVSDIRMPKVSGLDLLRIIKKEYPHIIGMVLSGYGQDATLQKAVNQGEIFTSIPKPWKLGGNFETFVRRAIDHYNLQSEPGWSGGRKLEKRKAKLRE